MASKSKIPREESRNNSIYNKALKRPVNEKAFFLEAGQGRNVNGNVFALLRYIRSCPDLDDHKVMLSLVPDKYDEARQKLSRYGIKEVEFVEFGGDAYRRALAEAKYLITDNSFPAYFYKRPEQVYLNTWHGTPLKALGRTDLENAVSIANVQANMAKADWLLHPNRFTKDIMMRDYMMDRVFTHKTVIMDYPRNDALYRAEFRDEIIERYGLERKRLIAYMPTWRGTGRDADIAEQLARTESVISDMQDMLRDEEVLFVNLHFLLDAGIDCSAYGNVRSFPSEYETYDFLSACDVLITDYSSVSIDFAGTGKEIILYLYDYDQYRRDKGFYYDVKELPFKKACTAEELDVCLHEPPEEYRLDDSMTCREKGNSSEKLIKLICGKDPASAAEIEDFSLRRHDAQVEYFENINRDVSRALLKGMNEKIREGVLRDPLIMFPDTMSPETIDTLRSLDRNIDFIRISGRMYCSNDEFRMLRLCRKYGIMKRKAAEIYRREAYRNIGQFGIGNICVRQCANRDRFSMFRQLGCGCTDMTTEKE